MNDMKNLIQRTLSGILVIAAIVAGLLLGKYFFCCLMIVLMLCIMKEYFRMTMGNEYRFSQILAMFAAVTLFVLTFLYMGFNLPGRLVMLAFIPIFQEEKIYILMHPYVFYHLSKYHSLVCIQINLPL